MNEANPRPRAARRAIDSAVRELMTTKVLTIQADESAVVAEELMIQGGVRHLPVMRGEALVGVISDRDLLAIAHEATRMDLPVRAIMTAPPETADPNEGVDEASARMAARRIDCLPVVDEGRVVGILTSTDILAERGRLVHKGNAGPGHLLHARDIMHRRVLTIGTDLPLVDAAQALVRSEIRHLPVINAAGRIVGMFSARELRAAGWDPTGIMTRDEKGALAETTVEAAMRPGPVTIAEGASILEVADAFLDERVTAVCVVNAQERLVGLISYVDVLAGLVGRKA
jgi:CBS domain-containing protein